MDEGDYKAMNKQEQCKCKEPTLQPQTKQCGRCNLYIDRRQHILLINDLEYIQLKRLYDWLREENREPAQTKFTAGLLRNVAKEIEYQLTLIK